MSRSCVDELCDDDGFPDRILTADGEMSLTHAAGADETDLLLCDAARGDAEAIRSLLERHRTRLRRMISLRLDSHLAARVDASDVVQEALFDAARKLAGYARERPLPFYAWLLPIGRRTRGRRPSAPLAMRIPQRPPRGSHDENLAGCTARMLADRLVVTDPTPGHVLIRQELQEQVHAALARLAPSDRDVLVCATSRILAFPKSPRFSESAKGRPRCAISAPCSECVPTSSVTAQGQHHECPFRIDRKLSSGNRRC